MNHSEILGQIALPTQVISFCLFNISIYLIILRGFDRKHQVIFPPIFRYLFIKSLWRRKYLFVHGRYLIFFLAPYLNLWLVILLRLLVQSYTSLQLLNLKQFFKFFSDKCHDHRRRTFIILVISLILQNKKYFT